MTTLPAVVRIVDLPAYTTITGAEMLEAVQTGVGGTAISVQIPLTAIMTTTLGGLPTGGGTSQILGKSSGGNYSTAWYDITSFISVNTTSGLATSGTGTALVVGVATGGIGSAQLGALAVQSSNVTTNAIGNAQFRQGSPLSVVGVAGAATANVADIIATGANQVLQVNAGGTGLTFTTLAQSSAFLGITNTGLFNQFGTTLATGTFGIVGTTLVTGLFGVVGTSNFTGQVNIVGTTLITGTFGQVGTSLMTGIFGVSGTANFTGVHGVVGTTLFTSGAFGIVGTSLLTGTLTVVGTAIVTGVFFAFPSAVLGTSSGYANATTNVYISGTRENRVERRGITGGAPVASGTTDANQFITFGTGNIAWRAGMYTNFALWLQPSLVADYATDVGMYLSPNGGGVAIGAVSSSATLVTLNVVGTSLLTGALGIVGTALFTSGNFGVVGTTLFTSGAFGVVGTARFTSNFAVVGTANLSGVVILPGVGSGTLVASATGVVTGTTVGAGDYVLLNTLSPSGVASTNDTSSFSSTYSRYMITFDNVVPATNTTFLQMQVATSGSNFISGGYVGVVLVNTSSFLSVDTSTTAMILTGIRATTAMQTSTVYGANGYIYLVNPANAVFRKSIVGAMSWPGAGASVGTTTLGQGQINGIFDTNSNAVTGVNFLFNSGNIATGTIRIYGIT